MHLMAPLLLKKLQAEKEQPPRPKIKGVFYYEDRKIYKVYLGLNSNGSKKSGYHKDFFEAMCLRKSWEASKTYVPVKKVGRRGKLHADHISAL